MPKTPVIASMAASRPITPSAAVVMRAGNSTRASASGQVRMVKGKLAIDTGRHAIEGRHYLGRGYLRTDDEGGICLIFLGQREEHCGGGFFSKASYLPSSTTPTTCRRSCRHLENAGRPLGRC